MKHLLLISVSIAISFLLNNALNDWYATFYKAIHLKSSISICSIHFILINGAINLNTAIKNIIKIKFIGYERKNIQFIQKEKFDSAQKISQEHSNYLKGFIECFDASLIGIGTILFFLPKLILNSSIKPTLMLIILFFYSISIFIFKFGIIKKLQKYKYYQYQESEAKLRNFLNTWFNKKCIKPIDIFNEYFENAIINMENFNFSKILIESMRMMHQNIGLILPFIILYNAYCKNDINFGQLMQLINLWSQNALGINSLAHAIEYFNEYQISKHRFKYIKTTKEKSNKNIKLQNINIIIKNKRIIRDFSLEINYGEKFNIMAPNKTGKTTLMNALQGYKSFEGKINIPENIVFIPEQPIAPAKTKLNSTQKFKDNCNIFDINPELYFENASGAEKWALIASYALCFDYIVWDDPFWGISEIEINLAKLTAHKKGMLFFSTQPINNMQIIEL